MVVMERIAQLRIIQKARKLDHIEQRELDLCLDWVVNYTWKKALRENYSLMASMTNDVDWQHEVCREIEEDDA